MLCLNLISKGVLYCQKMVMAENVFATFSCGKGNEYLRQKRQVLC